MPVAHTEGEKNGVACFCIGKSEKKGAENEPAAGVLFCAPQAKILRNRGPKNRDPSEKCNHFGVRLEQIGMGF